MDSKEIKVDWRVHTPNLLKEVLENPGMAILNVPISILARLLAQVGERAAQLNDPELNMLMIRLTIYEAADPNSPDFDEEIVRYYLGGEYKEDK